MGAVLGSQRFVQRRPLWSSSEASGIKGWDAEGGLYKPPKKFTGRYIVRSGAKGGPCRGAETPDKPDEPVVLDGGDVVEGVGVVDLASGSTSASGWIQVLDFLKKEYSAMHSFK